MEVAVGGERVAAPRAVLAGERGEHAARLAHDHVHGRHVVHLQLGLGGQVDGPLRDEHVGPEVAVGPGPPHPPHQRDEVVHLAALLPAVQGRVGQRRVLEAAYVGDVALRGLEQRAAGPRAVARRGPPAPLELRGRHDAEHDLVVDGERDQGGPDGDAADEVLRAVDRVHDPAPLAVAGRALLLAGHRVPRPDPRQGAADGLLDGLVGVGDRRQVGLAHDVQVEGLEPVRGRARPHHRRGRARGADRRCSPARLSHYSHAIAHNVDAWRSTAFPCTRSSCTPRSSSGRSPRSPVSSTPSRSGATSCAGRWWSPSASPSGRSGSPTCPARRSRRPTPTAGSWPPWSRPTRSRAGDAAAAHVRLRRRVVRGRVAARADRPDPAPARWCSSPSWRCSPGSGSGSPATPARRSPGSAVNG